MTVKRVAKDGLIELQGALREFVSDRDWDQFHSPKNLATGLSIEAGELLEQFQWLSDSESQNLTPKNLQAVREEMADVLLYLLRLSDKLDVDLVAAGLEKLELNAKKYPIEKAKGSRKKYSDL